MINLLIICSNFTDIIEAQVPLQETTLQHNGSVKNVTVIDESNNEIPVELDAKATAPTVTTVEKTTITPKATETTTTTVVRKEKDDKGETLSVEKEIPYLGASTVDLSGGEIEFKLLKYPYKESCFTQLTWIITWPIYLVFKFTIPDCDKNRFKKWYPLTFIMCIVWIGSLSYLVAWFITIVGKQVSRFCCKIK